MRLKILEIAAVGRGAFRREDEIVFDPHNQSGRLILPKEILEFRIQRHVRAVVIHEVHLDIGVRLPEAACRVGISTLGGQEVALTTLPAEADV
jgi:hypothetical protein